MPWIQHTLQQLLAIASYKQRHRLVVTIKRAPNPVKFCKCINTKQRYYCAKFETNWTHFHTTHSWCWQAYGYQHGQHSTPNCYPQVANQTQQGGYSGLFPPVRLFGDKFCNFYPFTLCLASQGGLCDSVHKVHTTIPTPTATSTQHCRHKTSQ